MTAVWVAALLLYQAPEQIEFFEKHVRPVLARNCYPCHSAATKSPMGGLRLDTPEGAQNPKILDAISHRGALKMPPTAKLPDDQIANLTAWIKAGSPYPRSASRATAWAFQPIADPPEPRVKSLEWVRSPIDSFILAKLEEKGLAPALPAERRALIRRVTLDLTGLPPTVEETDAFLRDRSQNAYAHLVDRLLASPRYGERWARHWLDLVRYAETNGHEFDNDKLDPWRYRDYVIRAFNDDVPYNQFVREHIAGDLLPKKRVSRDGTFLESPIATSFFWFGEVLNSATDSVKSRADEVDNQIDVAGKAFLGLTVACARCHDHKFDPIPTADYYALAGVFHSTALREDVIDSPRREERIRELSAQLRSMRGMLQWRAARLRPRPDDEVFEGTWRTAGIAFGNGFQGRVASSLAGGSDHFTGTLTSRKFETSDKLYLHVRVAGSKADGKLKELGPLRFTMVCDGYKGQHVVPNGSEQPRWTTLTLTLERHRTCYFEIVDRRLEGHIALDAIVFSGSKEPPEVEEEGALPAFAACPACGKIESQIPESAFAMLASDEDPHNVRVHLRGDHHNLGQEAPRRFLQAIAGENQQPIINGSGRLELAEWFAGERNPLTARVMVNRVWKHHFGQGIVATPDNFGVMGEPPSNPELLDFLATRFIESGWSVKALHRLILLSSTYQMSSVADPAALTVDPRNKLLQHSPVQRLDAEAVRDSVLAVAGTLKPELYGPSIPPHISDYQDGRGKPASGPLDGNGRRSIYIQVRRNFISPLFLAFDYPLPISSIGARSLSTVPSQALLMMNNEFIAEQSRAWARRAIAAKSKTRERVDWMFRIVFIRPATAAETDEIVEYIESRKDDPAEDVWSDVAHVLFNSAEFLYVP